MPLKMYEPDVPGLVSFLRHLGLDKYLQQLLDSDIDSVSVIDSMKDEDLKQITSVGAMVKIRAALKLKVPCIRLYVLRFIFETTGFVCGVASYAVLFAWGYMRVPSVE